MNPRKAFFRRLAEPPVEVPATVDLTAELRQVAQSALADMTNRKRTAIRLIDDKLNEQRALGGARDAGRYNDLLELRHALEPGSRILPVRPSVPVIPGRAS